MYSASALRFSSNTSGKFKFMIEKLITIDRETAIKAYKKAHRPALIKNLVAGYGGLGFSLFIMVALIDMVFDSRHLIVAHLLAIFGLITVICIYLYFQWVEQLTKTMKDYDLDVILDDEGVTIRNNNNKRIAWNEYAYFKEYEDYLEITNKTGEVSLLPKRDEYARVIVFTKTKIPNKNSE